MDDNKYNSNVWDGINIFFGIATFITSIVFIALFVMCFIVPVNKDIYGTIIGMCGVFASLASAFFIAVFVRYFDLKRKSRQESKALNIITPNLIEIYTVINGFLPQIKAFVTINEDDTIIYPKERVYYTDDSLETGNRNYIDFASVFFCSKSNLDAKLEKNLKAPMIFQCNESVVDLLTRIQLNGFTHNLFEIQGALSVFDPSTTTYISLHDNFKELWELYEELAKLVQKKTNEHLRKLNDDERDIYIKEIEAILPQLPTDKGSVFLGNKRIR
ncbi:MAG: hypothetical protein IKV76_01625 [Clostridia bacterium]|nr:hypothetical protein [Clostridia bacterium]